MHDQIDVIIDQDDHTFKISTYNIHYVQFDEIMRWLNGIYKITR